MRDGARGSTALMTEEEIDEIQQADLCQPVPSSAPRGLCQWTAVTRSLSNWLFRADLYTGQCGRVTSMLYALEWRSSRQICASLFPPRHQEACASGQL